MAQDFSCSELEAVLAWLPDTIDWNKVQVPKNCTERETAARIDNFKRQLERELFKARNQNADIFKNVPRKHMKQINSNEKQLEVPNDEIKKSKDCWDFGYLCCYNERGGNCTNVFATGRRHLG